VQWLQQHPTVNVLVSGNCDERGTEEYKYNLGLGQRRAATDADFLVAQGVSAARLQTISYGKDRPVDPGSTPEALAKNRNAITQAR
jgi:peptidoglycan-associated lipoprotein